MVNLDSLEEIKAVDKSDLYKSIKALPDQVDQAWSDGKKLDIPNACFLAKNVVVAGMGGSALGARIIDSLFVDSARTPIEIFTQYHIPNYVDKNSLVIVSSYSGNTEEVLSDSKEAITKGAVVFGITTGGRLENLLKKNKLPYYKIDPLNNPSGQPRMAIGYSIAATMAILARCNHIKLADKKVKDSIRNIKRFGEKFDRRVKSSQNLAKQAAKQMFGKVPVLVSSEHLVGATYAFKNQLNEGAKTFSVAFDIPELNHHLMEGLANPSQIQPSLYFLFFESSLYSPRVQKRYPITKQVVNKNRVGVGDYELKSKSKLDQVCELLSFGSFTHYYLAILYNQDPKPIPWVDFFKSRL